MITAAKALEDLDGLGLDAEARALFLGGNAVRVFDSLRKPGCLASRSRSEHPRRAGRLRDSTRWGTPLPRRKATRSGMPPSPFIEAGEMIEYQARNRKSAACRTGLLSSPIAADCGKALVEAAAAAARDEPHSDQRTATQSRGRFDTTISRLGPPVPDDAGGGLPALLFDLQRLAVEQTIDESFREPADSSPQYPRLCDEAAPKWPGPPGQSDRQLPVWRLISVQTERLFLPQLDRDYSFAPTPPLPNITVVIFCWRILLISESMGHHDSEIMDDRSID